MAIYMKRSGIRFPSLSLKKNCDTEPQRHLSPQALERCKSKTSAPRRIEMPNPIFEPDTRPIWRSMGFGWRRKCPNCGQGALFKNYLSVRPKCTVCRQDLFHHRADDGPAYLTILIVAHIMAPLLHFTFVTWRLEPLVMLSIFTVGCLALSLYLLPRLKGVIIECNGPATCMVLAMKKTQGTLKIHDSG